jgi:hypothetical protein
MTTLEEVQTMVAESRPDEWSPFNDIRTWTYQHDVALRIQRTEQLDANVQAPWTQHLQAASQSYSYLVYYWDSPVEYHTIVSVDNFRAHIPFPQQPQGPSGPFTITGDAQTFEAYLNNTGMDIQG